jgi:hypothetical protein
VHLERATKISFSQYLIGRKKTLRVNSGTKRSIRMNLKVIVSYKKRCLVAGKIMKEQEVVKIILETLQTFNSNQVC